MNLFEDMAIRRSSMVDYIKEINNYLQCLFPITRSLAGDGNRETLRILREIIPLELIEYPTGKKCYDWVVPREWRIRDAWIKNDAGEKIVDFNDSNLHVVSHSTPIHQKMHINDLKAHLYTNPKLPEAIPYRTSYYKENWGFCLSHNLFREMLATDTIFEVFIDSELYNGSMTVGEYVIPGSNENEFLISTYICHPSMANDNLSGLILTALLARELASKNLNTTFRFLFLPETIGAIAYCEDNEAVMKNIDAGFVITTVGGPGQFGYKQSINPSHWINRTIEQVFAQNNLDYTTCQFVPVGSDERQFSSQEFNINTATIFRDKFSAYPYYHTSLDNLDYVNAEYINKSLNLYLQAVDMLDKRIIYKNLHPHCEVMLSRYGLYPEVGGADDFSDNILTEADIMLALLLYCNGRRSMQEIAKIMNIPMDRLITIAEKLESISILKKEAG